MIDGLVLPSKVWPKWERSLAHLPKILVFFGRFCALRLTMTAAGRPPGFPWVPDHAASRV